MTRILTVEIRDPRDLVPARQRARQVAALLGFEAQDQVRVATAVSELARNALQYAGQGRIEFTLEGNGSRALSVVVQDRGPGIADLQGVLDGRVPAPAGRGMGLVRVRRLMDRFEAASSADGTRVAISKLLPPKAPALTPDRLAALSEELVRAAAGDALDEMQRQNQELLQVMEQLHGRQQELEQLNRELEETNRGVVALYAELEASAESLRRASELKSKFLSNMSHEFRTPLNSIRSLTRILLERMDGDLSAEQEKQISLIRKSAESLTELVNDLLDLAKVEAGKLTASPERFRVADLFGALRGMLRPLLPHANIELVFEEPQGVPDPYTDEGKVSQILRNFVSNALKFTERGEVRVSARCERPGRLTLSVSDTGVGIPPEHQERIFEEFHQVEGPLQKRVRGTGLGLPLSKRLAELLGGRIGVESRVGEGSTFFLEIPLSLPGGETSAGDAVSPAETHGALRPPSILVIDDDETSRYVMKVSLAGEGSRVVEAGGGEEGLRLAVRERPDAIVLDIVMPGLSGFEILERLKADERTRGIPVIVNTSKVLGDAERRRLDGAAAILTKEPEPNEASAAKVRGALARAGLRPAAGEARHG